MASWAEAKQGWLMTQLSETEADSIKNLERRFLYSALSVTNGSIQELWKDWLSAQAGVSGNGSVHDLWEEFLREAGYSGSVREMQKAYFEA